MRYIETKSFRATLFKAGLRQPGIMPDFRTDMEAKLIVFFLFVYHLK